MCHVRVVPIAAVCGCMGDKLEKVRKLHRVRNIFDSNGECNSIVFYECISAATALLNSLVVGQSGQQLELVQPEQHGRAQLGPYQLWFA